MATERLRRTVAEIGGLNKHKENSEVCGLQARGLIGNDGDAGFSRNQQIKELGYVLVPHTNAAVRGLLANGSRLISAMYAVVSLLAAIFGQMPKSDPVATERMVGITIGNSLPPAGGLVNNTKPSGLCELGAGKKCAGGSGIVFAQADSITPDVIVSQEDIQLEVLLVNNYVEGAFDNLITSVGSHGELIGNIINLQEQIGGYIILLDNERR